MNLNIVISEKDILSGNVEPVRKNLESILDDGALIKKYEGSISFYFGDMDFFELAKKLHIPTYKAWFRQVNKAFPAMPYFLSVTRNSSLLIFLMGVIDFTEKGSNITFNNLEANRFFREKNHEIRNLCLSNNLNPQSSLERLNSILVNEGGVKTEKVDESMTEKLPQQSPRKQLPEIFKLLEKYGSIAVFTSTGVVKLFYVFDEPVSGEVKILKNILVFDKKRKLNYFSTLFEESGIQQEKHAILLYSPEKVLESMEIAKGVKIEGVAKNESGEFFKFLDFDSTEEAELLTIEDEPAKDEKWFNDESSDNFNTKSSEKPNKNDEKATAPEKRNDKKMTVKGEDSSETERLRKENGDLRNRIAELQSMINLLEENLKKKEKKGIWNRLLK